jgi:hypothetical protein
MIFFPEKIGGLTDCSGPMLGTGCFGYWPFGVLAVRAEFPPTAYEFLSCR